MNLFSIIMPPVIGGIIGAVTNDLAIKMLFRPYKAIYLWGRRLPFTPGIVPKNMDFLADALGREIVRRFFNADDLEILFQSDVFSDAVAGAVTDYFYSKKTTLCLTMEGMERSDDMGTVINNGKREICRYINEALAEYNFAPVINATVAEIADGRHGAAIPRTAKSSIKSVAPYISEALRDYLKQHGEKLIAPVMDNLLVEFADRPTKTIVESVFGDRESFKAIVKKAYLTFMATYVRDVVESIDVGGMISEKFRQMEPEAIEALILSIVKKELNYVVLLGGILGMVIGAVNILI